MICGFFTDKFGRKPVYIIASVFTVLFTIIMIFMNNIWALSAMRICQGFFVGCVTSVVPTYTAELSTDQRRGTITTLYQVSVVMGITIGTILNVAFDFVNEGWKYLFGFCGISPLIVICALWKAPESPLWLFKQTKKKLKESGNQMTDSKTSPSDSNDHYQSSEESKMESGKEEKPADSVETANTESGAGFSAADSSSTSTNDTQPSSSPESSPSPNSSTDPIATDSSPATASPESSPESSSADDDDEDVSVSFLLKELWKQKKSLVIGLILAFNLQMTGVNAIGSYTPVILGEAGVTTRRQSLIISIPVVIWDFCSVLFSLCAVQCLGRRPLLIIGSSVAFLGELLVVIFSLTLSVDEDSSDTRRTLSVTFNIIGIAIFLFGFQFGVAPSFYVLIAELFKGKVRGLGSSLCFLMSWLCNIAVVQMYLPLLEAIGQGYTFMIFVVIAFLSLVFDIFVVKETKSADITG